MSTYLPNFSNMPYGRTGITSIYILLLKFNFDWKLIRTIGRFGKPEWWKVVKKYYIGKDRNGEEEDESNQETD